MSSVSSTTPELKKINQKLDRQIRSIPNHGSSDGSAFNFSFERSLVQIPDEGRSGKKGAFVRQFE